MAEDLDYLNNLIDQGTDTNGEVDVEMALLALCMRRNNAILKVVGFLRCAQPCYL